VGAAECNWDFSFEVSAPLSSTGSSGPSAVLELFSRVRALEAGEWGNFPAALRSQLGKGGAGMLGGGSMGGGGMGGAGLRQQPAACTCAVLYSSAPAVLEVMEALECGVEDGGASVELLLDCSPAGTSSSGRDRVFVVHPTGVDSVRVPWLRGLSKWLTMASEADADRDARSCTPTVHTELIRDQHVAGSMLLDTGDRCLCVWAYGEVNAAAGSAHEADCFLNLSLALADAEDKVATRGPLANLCPPCPVTH
jgi:hypothetical protein